MKVAIVGRRNVGKSTFINTLVSAPRMIVSEVPGTTRDSVDVRFELDGKPFVAIDTPGIRKAKSRQTDIDFYGTHRAQRSIRRADVVLLFFDATQRISKVDKQLCDYIAAAIQAVHLRRQQVGPAGQHDADRQMGSLPAGRIRHDALRADRVHHGPDRQERESADQPRPDAVQAIASPRDDGPAQSHAARGGAPELAAVGPQPRAEDLLRHAGRHPAADDRAVRQRSRS